jgi:hypothetical protein
LLAATNLLAVRGQASPKGAEWSVIDTPDGCGSCHLGSPDPTDSSAVSIEGLPRRARPAESYTLEIVLSDPELKIAGFLLDVSSANAPSGTLASVDATTETQGARARSTRSGNRPASAGAMRWTVVWTAPSALAGPVRFTIWANAGNDDLSPLGDRLHHHVLEIPAAH